MTEHTETPLPPAEREVRDLIARVARRGATIELSVAQVTDITGRRRSRSRTLYAPLGALVAVAAAVALLLFLVAGPATHQPAAPSRSAGSSSLRMELVKSTSSPFQSVGGGPQTGDLLCVTASTCYASESDLIGSGWEATTDGGVSWHALAPLPGGRHLTDPVSCPTSTTCIGSDAPTVPGVAPAQVPGLAWTSDGGRSWRLDPLPVSAGAISSTVEQLSCPTASDCVAFLADQGVGSSAASTSNDFFMTTTDGGSTWTSSAAPAGLTDLWTLRCDGDGDCIGLIPAGTVQDPSTESHCRHPLEQLGSVVDHDVFAHALWPRHSADRMRRRPPLHCGLPGRPGDHVRPGPNVERRARRGRPRRPLRAGRRSPSRSVAPTVRTATSPLLTPPKRGTDPPPWRSPMTAGPPGRPCSCRTWPVNRWPWCTP